MEPGNSTTGWRPVTRVLFRFAFAYLFLYIFPFPLNAIPYVDAWVAPYDGLWSTFVPWVGKHLFHVDITVFPNGSGDTTYNYVQVFIYAVLAAAVALIWSVLDRRRTQYTRLYDWLRIYVRFSLATAMMSYGAIKIIKSQFPSPSLDRLLQPIGDQSPMGLLWTFMGFSASYNVFTGLGEFLGGLLLTTRRTLLLGALLSIAVLSNIVMLNFSYDVPVKLYSLHLLAMAVFLCLPELRRLAHFFVLNRSAEPVEFPRLFARRWLDRGALAVRTIFVVGFAGLCFYQAWDGRKTYGDLAPRAALRGIWDVDQFEADGKTLPPLVNDPIRWHRVIFDRIGRMGIQSMNESRRRFSFKEKPRTNVIMLTRTDDPKWKSTLSYTQTGPGLVAMEGMFDGRKVRATLRRVDKSDFLLISRGFHWINEYPLNH
ncbi:MAG: hypothetical protein JF614_03295 [Acidobacteria bacterium]|nr:hypothetical protein [Acidobacteriota bacterium]